MYTTFVINLDKDTERMQFMHEQLARLGIAYRRETAILGKSYNPSLKEYNESYAIKKGGHALLPGEIGCALSHSRVIQKIIDEKIPYTLVLEDDVSLPIDFHQIIETEIAKNENSPAWEYLLFDYVVVGRIFIRQWLSGVAVNLQKTWQTNYLMMLPKMIIFFLKAMYIIPLSIFEGLRNHYKKSSPGPVRFFREVYFAGAYIVTYEGALKLRTLSQPVIYTADHLPNKARILTGLKFRGYAPQIVRQNKHRFGSSILEIEGGLL